MFLLVAMVLLSEGKVSQGLLSTTNSRLPEVDFIHRVEMDQQGAFFLLWTPREEDIIFEVQVSLQTV